MDTDREEACAAILLPKSMSVPSAGYEWARNKVGSLAVPCTGCTARQGRLTCSSVIGCIDAGRVGVADRYQDLAILWNCLEKFDASLQDRLLEQYGIAEADERKLQFYFLLDEMF